ncbi:hypothetical protein OHA25_10140 [Nonomuraea sp. NBC_00507]
MPRVADGILGHAWIVAKTRTMVAQGLVEQSGVPRILPGMWLVAGT